jgi:hypothetical protein
MRIGIYKDFRRIVLIPSIGIDFESKIVVIGWLFWSINFDMGASAN